MTQEQDLSATAPSAPPGPQVSSIDPQKLLRIAGVTREVLEEARRIRPEAGAIDHLRRVHGQISGELQAALPAELWTELDELTPDIKDGTLEELSLAHAEILGWLEGLFQGTHLALQAQAAQAAQMLRHQMAEAERAELTEGADSSKPTGPAEYL
ncbi:MAG: proteasome activator [Actinomycetota bacterium]